MSTVNRFYGAITGATIDQLGDIVNEVNQNSDQKAVLRQMRDKLQALKQAVHQGDMGQAAILLEELRAMAPRAGLSADDPIFGMLHSVDLDALGTRTEAFSADELEVWDQFFDDFDRAIKLELDERSDLSNRQQTELNYYSAQLRQSEQAMSDIDSRWNSAVKEVIANLRA